MFEPTELVNGSYVSKAARAEWGDITQRHQFKSAKGGRDTGERGKEVAERS